MTKTSLAPNWIQGYDLQVPLRAAPCGCTLGFLSKNEELRAVLLLQLHSNPCWYFFPAVNSHAECNLQDHLLWSVRQCACTDLFSLDREDLLIMNDCNSKCFALFVICAVPCILWCDSNPSLLCILPKTFLTGFSYREAMEIQFNAAPANVRYVWLMELFDAV